MFPISSALSASIPPAYSALAASFPPGSQSLNFPTGVALGTSIHSSIMSMILAIFAPSGSYVELISLWAKMQSAVARRIKIDITRLFAKLTIVCGAIAGTKTLWKHLKPHITKSFTYSLTIPVEHQVARQVKEYLAANGHGAASSHIQMILKKSFFNYARNAVEYETEKHTAVDSIWFLYRGRPLYFEKIEPPKGKAKTKKGQETSSDEMIRLSTPRLFSMDLLESFLQDVQSTKSAEEHTTPVATINPDEDESKSWGVHWVHSTKASRPLSTIDLDEDVKREVVRDIEQFVSVERARWYRLRGIPYLRGLLFLGPPGTLKSSTGFALASHVKKELYTICLNEVRDEPHLRLLFAGPSAGDILLLEDIDSAGIVREQKPKSKQKSTEKEKAAKKEEDDDDDDDEDNDDVKLKKKKGISLSGLLNAIDTARKEGVILIMTTNKPEDLDQALIRPGRIDQKLLFGFVSQAVAARIFTRMYQDHGNHEELETLANGFASKIPDLRLTPAEVQGFLIPRETPERALSEVETWVAQELALKDAGRNTETFE